MSRGIVIIGFGEEYCKLAANTLKYSLSNIGSLPVTVLTNLKEPCKEIAALCAGGVNRVFIDLPTEQNRAVKTELDKYSPYDETLYVDCDAVFVKPGIEKIFDHLLECDLVLQYHSRWVEGKKYYRLYRDCMKKLSVDLPITVYIGGFFAFRKSQETRNFFDIWHKNWIDCSVARDMPALACAIKQCGIKHNIIHKKVDKLFSFGITDDAIVVHRVHANDLTEHYGIPEYKQNKLYDKKEWQLIFFDDKSNSIIENEWVKTKFNRQLRMSQKSKYINTYLPEIKNGNLNVLDIATGPGEFLEIARTYKCFGVGIESNSGMLNRPEDKLYEEFNALSHAEHRLDIVHADVNEIIETGCEEIDKIKWDIINCKHAINLIFKECFDFKIENGEYRNHGSWIFSDLMDAKFRRMFAYFKKILNANGSVMISALHSENAADYSYFLKNIAREYGFVIEIEDGPLNHKFRRVA